MKNHLNLRNTLSGTKCKLRNGDTAVILMVLDKPLVASDTVIGYRQYTDTGNQTPESWHIDGLWNSRSDPECREMDIIEIMHP